MSNLEILHTITVPIQRVGDYILVAEISAYFMKAICLKAMDRGQITCIHCLN